LRLELQARGAACFALWDHFGREIARQEGEPPRRRGFFVVRERDGRARRQAMPGGGMAYRENDACRPGYNSAAIGTNIPPFDNSLGGGKGAAAALPCRGGEDFMTLRTGLLIGVGALGAYLLALNPHIVNYFHWQQPADWDVVSEKPTVKAVPTNSDAETIAGHAIAAPILVPGVQEPEEMRIGPFPIPTLTAPERMVGEALGNPTTLLPALNRILAQYPDFSNGFILRVGELCKGIDRGAIMADLDRALKLIDASPVRTDSIGTLLSMRAKIESTNGDYAAAMNDLERAINADLINAMRFTNSGAVKPEKTASVCVWTQPDMDTLVQRFPTDYRSYLFRGLYFGFFARFDEGSLQPAIDNLNKAAELNAKSALPHLFKATLLGKVGFLKRIGWDDAQRNNLDSVLRIEYDKALTLDPNLLPALHGRAEARFNLRQFQGAIADYNKILALDPQDAGAYNDRGLANMQIGQDYEAIADISKAIKIKSRGAQGDFDLEIAHNYVNRADSYMKARQWDLAILDLTAAISLHLRNALWLMNIDQFRALYPEYLSTSNDAIMRKLHQTFFAYMGYEGFTNSFVAEPQLAEPSFVIADLYLKRSDAYLKKRQLASSLNRVSARHKWIPPLC
jgi:tetratricopeptide (TPR) repeat protein